MSSPRARCRRTAAGSRNAAASGRFSGARFQIGWRPVTPATASRVSQATNVRVGGSTMTARTALCMSVHPQTHRPRRPDTRIWKFDSQALLPKLVDQTLSGRTGRRTVVAAVPCDLADPINLVLDGLRSQHVVNSGGPDRPSRHEEPEHDDSGDGDSPPGAACRDERL